MGFLHMTTVCPKCASFVTRRWSVERGRIRREARDNLLIRGDALNRAGKCLETAGLFCRVCGRGPPRLHRPTVQHGPSVRELRRQPRTLCLANDDPGPARANPRSPFRGRVLSGSILTTRRCIRARCVLDEVFGASNFVANVIWQKTYTRENRTDISTSHDNVIVYAVNKPLWKKARNLLPASDAQRGRYSNPDNDPRGDWKSTPVHAKAGKGRRKEQFFTVTLPSGRKVDPPPGRCWLYKRERYEEVVAGRAHLVRRGR